MSVVLRKLAKGARLLRDRRFRPGLFKGVAATLEHRAALEPYAFSSVVDIGANRGQFTLLMAGLRPEATILAFEPLVEPYQRLVEVTARFPRVRAFNMAIGRERISLSMNVARRDDSSSLLPIGDLQEKVFPNTGLDRHEEVQVAPLGDFLDEQEMVQPRLLKIDVQGYELEVIRGSEAHLERFDVLYVEASFVELYEGQPLAGDVIDQLVRSGFRLAGVYNLSADSEGRAVQADFLFERDDRPAKADAELAAVASVAISR